MFVLKESNTHAYIVTTWLVWHGKIRKQAKTAYAWRHATARERLAYEAAGGHLVGAPGHHPSLVGCWVGLGHVPASAWPRFVVWMGLLLLLYKRSALRFDEWRIWIVFPLYSGMSSSNRNLAIQVELG